MKNFLPSIRDYKSKDSLLDVLHETRRCKVEEVTRFRYVREFIEEDDLDIFGQDKGYKIMMMVSTSVRIHPDPEIDYYVTTK